MSKSFRHIKNGREYKVVHLASVSDFQLKQSTYNQWESPVFYYDIETFEKYVTGEKRFKEKFIEIAGINEEGGEWIV